MKTKMMIGVVGAMCAMAALSGMARADADSEKYAKQIACVRDVIAQLKLSAAVIMYDWEGDSVILVETQGGDDDGIESAMAVCSLGVMVLKREMGFVPSHAIAVSGDREWHADPRDILECGTDMKCVVYAWETDY